ncbi:hypothetical protein NLU13_8529 [Sarocladium strictum]|uniref:Uncharacterized protein n=1 Tax=Sarocladium strictum TaxID=5046 RepID=A0AA39GBV7_SARSR|nr:hypothetical protein NLU13_8529 [Sarocladium strictum]
MKFTQLLFATYAIGALAASTPKVQNDSLDNHDPLAEPTDLEETQEVLEIRWTDENDIVSRTQRCRRHYELLESKCVRRCKRNQIRVNGKCESGCQAPATLQDATPRRGCE